MTDKRAALRAERERALIRQGAGPTLNQVIASKLKTISAAATDAGDDGERVPLPPDLLSIPRITIIRAIRPASR